MIYAGITVKNFLAEKLKIAIESTIRLRAYDVKAIAKQISYQDSTDWGLKINVSINLIYSKMGNVNGAIFLTTDLVRLKFCLKIVKRNLVFKLLKNR